MSGTATRPNDYLNFLQGAFTTITVPAGDTSATFNITIVDDMVNESEETIIIMWTRTPGIEATPTSFTFTGTITDNDGTGVSVSRTTLTVTEEDTTGGGYTVVLNTRPTANVTLTVAGHAGSDVTPSLATLTFTPMNWDTAQTVTVTAGNDADTADDTVSLTHSAASSDSNYNGITIAGVTVTVNDNDAGGGGGGGGGGFGPALGAPQFVDGFRTSRILVVTAQAGSPVGGPVAATHPDDLAMTYALSGTDATLFTVDEETGQIRLGQAMTLELGQTYTVNLTATDSSGTGAIIIVVIEVAFHPYDLDKSGTIELDEALAAVGDYFQDVITFEEVVEVVKLYFRS